MITLSNQLWNRGYESSLVLSRSPDDGFVTDDFAQRFYAGSLAAGESFEVPLHFCRRADVSLPDGVTISANHEDVRAEAWGRGPMRLEIVTERGVKAARDVSTQRNQEDWIACALYSDRLQDADGWWAGPVTVRLSNPGSRTIRDLTLSIEVNLDSSQLTDRCPS